MGIIKDTAVEGTGAGAVPAVQFHLGLRLQKRLGLGLRLAFYPDKVGFRNQKVIYKEHIIVGREKVGTDYNLVVAIFGE